MAVDQIRPDDDGSNGQELQLESEAFAIQAAETAAIEEQQQSDRLAIAPEGADEAAGLGSEDDVAEGEPSGSDDSDLGSEEDGDSDNDGAANENFTDVETLLEDLPPAQNLPAASSTALPTFAVASKDSWTGCPSPGQMGFNAFATRALRNAGVDKLGVDVGGLLPHQIAVASLLHQNSPIRRLLVDHPTGSGKTREMISVLDNFFYDPRPKVPIFPKESVCRNFYFELLKWPSKYRDFFSCVQPKAAKAASGVDDWRARRQQIWSVSHLKEAQVRRLCQTMRDTLEMKAAFVQGRMRRSVRDDFLRRFPEEPFLTAPLRALRYTSAGGGSIRLRNGIPVTSLFKIGFDQKSRNVYSNKVVVMDEVHNLVRTKTRYLRQLDKLRELLVSAENVLLAGFTGTPILSEPDEGQKLLDIIKGSSAPPDANEGYLASFQIRPLSLYPRSLPSGMPDAVLTKPLVSQFVHRVVLHGEVLKTIDIKLKGGYSGSKLETYCNLYAHPSSFHGGKSGTRTKILGSPEECAPKLLAIAREIAMHPGKALVLISKSHGYRPMLALMKQVAKSHRPSFEVATMEELSQFNDHRKNLRGEAFKVMVADAAQCAEGVSFLSVRRVFLAEVPGSPSSLIQLCSRALRMYGHQWLPTEEQEVRFFLYVAQMPSWLQTPLAAWALRVQPKSVEGRTMEVRARHFLGCLQRAGVHGLHGLKQFLHAYVHAKKTRNKSLDTEDVFGMLVQLGLWNEVKRIWEAEYEQLSEEDTLQPSMVNASVPDAAAQPRSRPGQSLVQAMQDLFKAKDLLTYQQTLAFETADETALRRLVRMTAAFAPALASLRSKAVDGDILRSCYDSKLEKECCDTIVLTFDGDAFMVPSGTDHSVSQTLELPAGWKVEQLPHVGTSALPKFCITDPSGRQYETSKDAIHTLSVEKARQHAHKHGQSPGSKIVLKGCESRPDLNGHRGTILEWVDAEGCWIVDLGEAGNAHVCPEHLEADRHQHELKAPANQAGEAKSSENTATDADGDLGTGPGPAAKADETKGVSSMEAPELEAQATRQEDTSASTSQQTPEVVVLDEEDVVDYFKDGVGESPMEPPATSLGSASMQSAASGGACPSVVPEIDLTHDISDYFRAPSKMASKKTPEHPAEMAHELADFLRLPGKANKTNPPERLTTPSTCSIDLTHELADYFRLTGASHQKENVTRTPSKEEHRARSNQSQHSAPCNPKRKLSDCPPGTFRAAGQDRELCADSKVQRRVFADVAAASAASVPQKLAEIPVADGNIQRGNQQQGGNQQQSDLKCSTKRKLAFSLPGLAKRRDEDHRSVVETSKQPQGANCNSGAVSADASTLAITPDDSSDVSAALEQSDQPMDKPQTKSAQLLDIIDLVDLDDGTCESKVMSCKSQMQHSLADWLRKTSVR